MQSHTHYRASFSLLGGRSHYEQVVQRVLSAQHSVWIATANLKELMVEDENAAPGVPRRRGGKRYRSVLECFDELAHKGVELRILHASLPSKNFRRSFDAHKRLVKGGLELRCCPRVHLKTVIVDGRFAYLGSANWTGAGLGAKSPRRRNFELGILTEDEALLDELQATYDHLYQGRECADCGLRSECEAPIRTD